MGESASLTGRIIHLSLDITLTPRDFAGELGDTDNAMEYGATLITALASFLRLMASAEGYDVQIEAGRVVY